MKKQKSSAGKINQEIIDSDEIEDHAQIIISNKNEGISQNDLERKERKPVGML